MAEAVRRHSDVMSRPLLVALGLWLGAPAMAESCAEPQSQFMTFVCADPELRAKWDAAEAAHIAALAQVPDAEIRAMITAEEDAELAALLTWDLSATLAKLEADPKLVAEIGQDQMATFDGPPPSPHEVLRHLVGTNLPDGARDYTWLADEALKMRDFRRRFSGGAFSGDALECGFVPPLEWGRGDLSCAGTIRVQNGNRVCGIVIWQVGNGHFYPNFVVADVEDGGLKLRATCAMREASGLPVCPFLEVANETDGWSIDATLKPEVLADLADVRRGAADMAPDLWANFAPTDALEACLTTPDYP